MITGCKLLENTIPCPLSNAREEVHATKPMMCQSVYCVSRAGSKNGVDSFYI